MEDRELELHRALRESQNKYTYFLLAASVAVIGFALKETSGDALDSSQLALGWAAILWAGSFFCGCMNLQYVNSSLYANAALLQIEKGKHSNVRDYSHAGIIAASEGIREAFRHNSDKAGSYVNWQFRLLILGSLSYIVWHILNMYIKAIVSGSL